MANSSKIIGALLIGAAAGAVLGILFAPSSGEETRQQIKDTADNLKSEFGNTVSNTFTKGKDAFADLKSKVKGSSESIVSEAKNAYSNSVSNG